MVKHLREKACHVGTPTETEEEDVIVFIALLTTSESAFPVQESVSSFGTCPHSMDGSKIGLKQGIITPDTRTYLYQELIGALRSCWLYGLSLFERVTLP